MDRRIITAFVLSMLFISIYNAYVLKPMMEKKAGLKENVSTINAEGNVVQSYSDIGKEKTINYNPEGFEEISSLDEMSLEQVKVNDKTTYLISNQGLIGIKHLLEKKEEDFVLPVPLGAIISPEGKDPDILKKGDLSWTYGFGARTVDIFWHGEKGILNEILSFKGNSGSIVLVGPVTKVEDKDPKSRFAKYNYGVIIGIKDKKGVKVKRILLAREKQILEALSQKVVLIGVFDKYKVTVALFDNPRRFMFFKDNGLFGVTSVIGPNEKALSVTWYSGLSRPEFMGKFPYKKQILKKGILSGITDVLFIVLKMFYKIGRNWGLAIIGLAIVFSLVFLPLTLKSYGAIKKMQKIQPELKALQEKYKDKPEELNRELVLLYHKHGVNPFSGCLPLFVQLPVFFALYPVLINTYELKFAKFLWIKDLSAPDVVVLGGMKIHLLPIILGGLMLLQQRFSSSGAAVDGQQKALMWMMPVVFLFIFYNMPSGLVLFWLVMSLFNIGQQIYISKYLS